MLEEASSSGTDGVNWLWGVSSCSCVVRCVGTPTPPLCVTSASSVSPLANPGSVLEKWFVALLRVSGIDYFVSLLAGRTHTPSV